ncbi:hypothetical protein ACSNOI_13500 [Actinomadura kijaniata]|uniref:hypothetical protein n=1 Tax=Actinomadura kijaniata TaxID=46161 RepID=UPI003F1A7D42
MKPAMRMLAVAGVAASAAVVAPAAQASTDAPADRSVSAAAKWSCNPKNHNPHICVTRSGRNLQAKITYMGKFSGPVTAYFYTKKNGGYYGKGTKTLSKRLSVKSPKGKNRTWYSPMFSCPKKATHTSVSYSWNRLGMVTETPVVKCR